MTVDNMNDCLEKNRKNLSEGCQKLLSKKGYDKCKKNNSDNCLSLAGDKRIVCNAEQQLSDSDECKDK